MYSHGYLGIYSVDQSGIKLKRSTSLCFLSAGIKDPECLDSVCSFKDCFQPFRRHKTKPPKEANNMCHLLVCKCSKVLCGCGKAGHWEAVLPTPRWELGGSAAHSRALCLEQQQQQPHNFFRRDDLRVGKEQCNIWL